MSRVESRANKACLVKQGDTKADGMRWMPLSAPKEIKKHPISGAFSFGADYGARTRHLHLGKVALYQMS